MKLAKFGRSFGLVVVLGLTGLVIGCGSATQPSPAEKEKLEAAGKLFREQQRKFQELRAKEGYASPRRGGAKKNGAS
jgi:hypothetical protein